MIKLLLDVERININAKYHNGLTVIYYALIGIGGETIEKSLRLLSKKR